MPSILKKDLAKDYGLTLSWRYAEVEFLGLPKLKDSRVYRLEHIYVPLRLCCDWNERFNRDKTLHVPQALQEQRRLVVLGDPGSGKSTLVKVLTYAFGEAKGNPYKRACGDLIPIPIILRTYNTRRWKTPADMLEDFIKTLDPDIRDKITPDWLLTHLETGKAILLIDGVDEVGSRVDREHLRDRIVMPLLQSHPAARAVITSRVVGYDEVPFEFIVPCDEIVGSAPGYWYVAPFNDEEIKQFVTRWYALRESFPDKQKEGVDSLMRALSQNDRVKRLVHNPQLLTLVALIHRVTANLPSGRVELYDKIVEAYLETLQVFRKLGTPARLDEMKRWLANVGWKMQLKRDDIQASGERQSSPQGDELLVNRAEIKGWLVEAIAKERGSEEAPSTAENFLDYVARRSGLLVPRGPDEFSFAHLTFQEYFAAFELRGRVRRFDQLAQECTRLVEKRHWHETLNLLFEMLTEFPGACDELLQEIITATQTPNSAAEFASLLLLDEQSGLSVANQERAAHYALDTACDNGSWAIINNLRQLSERSLNDWISNALTDKLQRTAPPSLQRYFFWVGSQLVTPWELMVCETTRKRAQESWRDDQVAAMTFVCGEKEAIRWAAARLSLPHWLSPLNSAQTCLAGELWRVLVNNHRDSARSLVMAQAALVCSLDNLLLLRINILISMNRELRAPLTKLLLRPLRSSLFFKGPGSTIIHPRIGWGPIRFYMLHASLDVLYHKLFLIGEGRLVVDSQSVDASAVAEDELLSFGMAAKQIVLTRSTKHRDDSLSLLPQSTSSDNWSSLIESWFLICLGSGTPALCQRFNDLLDTAVTEPQDFTFPPSLREMAASPKFLREEFPTAMRLLFRHEVGDPLLKPEWFDAKLDQSRCFLTEPHELYRLYE